MTGPSEHQPTGAEPSATARPKQIGGFEILHKIGQGGMGAVFQARQVSLDRIVALKVLPPSIAKDASFIERFQREARASAKLNHPHIVQGIDVGQDEATGLWYFAMEYVDGPSLMQVLKQQGVLPEERALKYVHEIAGALECAVANGIVHRDIKPDNILINGQDEAKLADLGLAKQISSQDPGVTQSGQSVGTPFYMAPEQVRGESDQIDIRSDLYALGGTLFHLVTGQPPFTGETAASIMAKHLVEPSPKANRINPSVSESTTRLILRMMQKKKEQRVQTPHEVIQQIERILNREDTAGPLRAARRETTGPRAPIVSEKEASQRPSMLPFFIGVTGVVVLGLIGFLLFAPSSKPAETAANKPRGGTPSPEIPPAMPGSKVDLSQVPERLPAPPVAKVEPVARPVVPPVPEDPAAAREQMARTRFVELLADEKEGRLPPPEVRLRLSQIVRDFGQTQAGKEAAARLALLPEPPLPPVGEPVLRFSFDRITLTAGPGRPAVADLSGGERNGALLNAVTVPGVVGEALQFNGRDSSVIVAPPPLLGPALTVAVWVRYDVAPTSGWQSVIICQDNGKAPRVFQLSTLDGKFCWHRFGNGADVLSKERIQAKRWYHAAATFDPLRREHRLYVDGVLVGQAPGSFVPDPAERICIGRKGSDEPRMLFNGAIDEVAIWSQALPEERIRELHERGRPDALQPVAVATEEPKKPVAPLPVVAAPPENKGLDLVVGVLKETVPLLSQNRTGDAVSQLERKAADPRLVDAQEMLKRAKADIEAASELRRQAVEALRAKTGQKISLKKGNGTITGTVKDDPRGRGVTLDVGGPELTLSAEQLHPQDVDTYAPRTGQPADELRRRGMLFLAANELTAAKDLFTKAREAGGGEAVAPYLEYLTVLELGEVEAAATKAWTAAEALFEQKRLKEAEAAYGAFQQKYGATRTAAQNAETLKQRLAAIAKANKPEIVFIAKDSMALFAVGYRQQEFPVQETDDPLGPFENKPVYFNQKTGTDVVYDVRSPRPLRELRWKGAAMQNMTIEILDAKGTVVASSGPHPGGNKWAEFTLAFEPRAQFVLRFRNHISTWYFIAELELK